MRVFQINAVPYGSTGRIMFQLADALKAQGHEALCTAGFTWQKCQRDDFFLTSGLLEKMAHIWMAGFTGRIGCFSGRATKRMLARLEEFQPDIIHLHNLHGWFVNLPMLFDYIKAHQIPVVWTLHDCWPITGHCPHFDGIGCRKWMTGCHSCPLYRQYPRSFVDASETMYRLKKEWFTGVKDLTVVTPSQWLASLVKQSFLEEYPVEVIPNGIDLTVFSPKETDVKARYGLEGKHLVLGISYGWDDKKGLDVFLELSRRLGEEYRILLVGTDEKANKLLPPEIISVRRTESQAQLAQLYSAADVFVNPTREDNFPTVNMEALACGTPLVTFATGGSPEIPDESCGAVVPKNDVDAMEKQIRRICGSHPYSGEACRKRAEAFPRERCAERYLALYRRKR